LETFEAHHLLRTTKDDVEVTKNEFIEYYKNISACIDDDKIFFLIVNTTSGLKSQPQYKRKAQNEGKSTALSEDAEHRFLPKQRPQNVFRSGMGSNENPLNNTHEYYPATNSAMRGNMSNAMHMKPSINNADDDNQSIISGKSN
jgi:hypothetical protein